MSIPPNLIYEFGSFKLATADRVLLHNGEVVRLTQKAYQILLLLIQNSGRLVTRERIMKEVWPDRFVEENNLTVNISYLRKALGKSYGIHEYIETVPVLGYRFAAEVSVSEAKAEDQAAKVTAQPKHSTSLALTVSRDGLIFNSLAVLPLMNASPNPEIEYLSDGITDSIINHLSKEPELRIIARSTVFRYKGREIDPQVLGRLLQVQAVLIGRIFQLGDRLVIRVELVDVEGGWNIWGDQYVRKVSDMIETQHEIAMQISRKLELKLPDQEGRNQLKNTRSNPEACMLYLKGRYLFNKGTEKALQRGLEFFQQALDIDPDFALAYSGIADCYTLGGLPLDPDLAPDYAEEVDAYAEPLYPLPELKSRAKQAAMRAIEIDDEMCEAYASLGFVQYRFDWNWEAAERELLRAIELKPNYAHAHHWYGRCLRTRGRLKEALAVLEVAQKLDPILFILNVEMASILYYSGDFESAIEQCLQTLLVEPNFNPARYQLGKIYTEKGMFDEALAEFRKFQQFAGGSQKADAAIGHVHALTGRTDEALKVLDMLREKPSQYVPEYDMALIHVALNQKDEALKELYKAYRKRCAQLLKIKVDPQLKPLHSDSRFADLLLYMDLQV